VRTRLTFGNRAARERAGVVFYYLKTLTRDKALVDDSKNLYEIWDGGSGSISESRLVCWFSGSVYMDPTLQQKTNEAIYDESVPGASMGWHTEEMILTFDILMLRSHLMRGHQRRIPHPSSPMSATTQAAGIAPLMVNWSAGTAAPTTDDTDISDEDFCLHFVFFFFDEEACAYPKHSNS